VNIQAQFLTRLLLAVLLGASTSIMAADAGEKRTNVWGTGVSLILPPGVAVAPLGTNYTNVAQDILVAISVGRSDRGISAYPKIRSMYPDPVESLQNAALSGSIYKRTRMESGGLWDGWWLEVKRGSKVLDLKIYYSGSDSKTFPALKSYLSSVSWDDGAIDPEVAFGLRLEIPKLQVVRAGAGALLYNEDGQPFQRGQYLLLNTAPQPFGKDISKFRKLCKVVEPTVLLGQSSSLRYAEVNGVNVCDAWKSAVSNGRDYYAAVLFSDGSLAQAKGHGDRDAFQQALLAARKIPRP
jgi:hypothetical protein